MTPTRRTLTNLARRLEADGGWTINPATGESAPSSGYAVSRHGSIVIGSRAPFSDLVDGIGQIVKQATADRTYAGAWIGPDGVAVLDVVDIVADFTHAVHYGRNRDQVSIFDLANGREISTGGTGGLS